MARGTRKRPLIGYFEGLAAERAIALHAADWFALRELLGLVLPQRRRTIRRCRARRLIEVETHEAVFTWILLRLANAGLANGKRVGIDAITLQANAALRRIVRRDTGQSYHTGRRSCNRVPSNPRGATSAESL